ncbi:hypothetical protein C7S18_17105 [Ahniella affigens]|uniref:Ubiquinone biosynthesis accessory factor UbiK n=1 Tax=Ahniella affigens TaxID=2021234 RepID=A0A2P1PVB2_9GAMM|nr:accessory factor UbiK family protein [Ahniella affigens]AVP98795.1 hypothetical protein C7S18_17105 [Ahniella affigens]
MINIRAIDELAERLATVVPPGLEAAKDDLTKTFRAVLTSNLDKLNLVPRDEFDVQRLVLLRTREKLESLERRLAELEGRLGKS